MTEPKPAPELAVLYGGQPATAFPHTDQPNLFHVYLNTDPGNGSMSFHRIHRSLITFITDGEQGS